MAPEEEVKDAVVALARALRKFAKARSWPPGDMRILITVNMKWDLFHVFLIGDRFETGDPPADQDLYDDIGDFLDEELKDDLPLRRSTGFLTKSPAEWRRRGGLHLGPDDLLIDEADLARWVEAAPETDPEHEHETEPSRPHAG